MQAFISLVCAHTHDSQTFQNKNISRCSCGLNNLVVDRSIDHLPITFFGTLNANRGEVAIDIMHVLSICKSFQLTGACVRDIGRAGAVDKMAAFFDHPQVRVLLLCCFYTVR